jgi:hypothetical protein
MANTGKATDTRLTRWKKILAFYQTQSGALSCNNAKASDTFRDTLVKVLRAILGICGNSGTVQSAPSSLQWQVVNGAPGEIDASVTSPGTAPCPQWSVRYRDVTLGDPFSQFGPLLVSQQFALDTSGGTGDNFEVQARWEGCTSGFSDWSASKFIIG